MFLFPFISWIRPFPTFTPAPTPQIFVTSDAKGNIKCFLNIRNPWTRSVLGNSWRCMAPASYSEPSWKRQHFSGILSVLSTTHAALCYSDISPSSSFSTVLFQKYWHLAKVQCLSLDHTPWYATPQQHK